MLKQEKQCWNRYYKSCYIPVCVVTIGVAGLELYMNKRKPTVVNQTVQTPAVWKSVVKQQEYDSFDFNLIKKKQQKQ